MGLVILVTAGLDGSGSRSPLGRPPTHRSSGRFEVSPYQRNVLPVDSSSPWSPWFLNFREATRPFDSGKGSFKWWLAGILYNAQLKMNVDIAARELLHRLQVNPTIR